MGLRVSNWERLIGGSLEVELFLKVKVDGNESSFRFMWKDFIKGWEEALWHECEEITTVWRSWK
jgi:hypothetical protein